MFSFLSFLCFFTDDFIYLQATCTTTQTANDVAPNHHEVAAVAMGLVVIIVVIIIMLCHTTSTMKFDYYGY